MIKKLIAFILLACVLTLTCTAQSVQPRWDATLKVMLAQDYYSGEGIYCYVEIVGYPNVTSIENIDIVLKRQVGNDWVETASWTDLETDGNEFMYEQAASNATIGETYRLEVTADVYYDTNSMETINCFMDKEY